jgi:hypothetical protein
LFQPLNETDSKIAAKLLTWELQQLCEDVKDWEILCVSVLELVKYESKGFEYGLRHITSNSTKMKKAFEDKKLSVVLDDYGAIGSWKLAEELHSQGISTFVTCSQPVSLSITKGLTKLGLGLGCIPLRVGIHISIQSNEDILTGKALRQYFTVSKVDKKAEMYILRDYSGSKTEKMSLYDLCNRDVQYDEEVTQGAQLCIWDGAKWIGISQEKSASVRTKWIEMSNNFVRRNFQENSHITRIDKKKKKKNSLAQRPNRWNHFSKTVENLNVWENVLYEFVSNAQKGSKYAYDSISNMKLELETQAIYLGATGQNDNTCNVNAKQLAKTIVCDERGSHRLSRATGDHFNVGILVIAMPGKIQFLTILLSNAFSFLRSAFF